MTRDTPLGKATEYSLEYDPELLFAVARSDARDGLGLTQDLPFRGVDIWNAWELTWLDRNGKPIAAIAEIIVDAASPNIIESKSLKLYLNSFAMTRFGSEEEVLAAISADLAKIAGVDVLVRIANADDSSASVIGQFPGCCIDDLNMRNVPGSVDAEILHCETDDIVTEELYSHLLRSNCPVTGQPDMGSVLILYTGAKIDRAALLEYIVSYRQHSDFHEACVERMFLDIKSRCRPSLLTVYARYNRRGGLDINPFRTDTAETPENLRLWRQ